MRLRKQLGQNFLVDKNIRQKIVKAAELYKDDVIIEIGAGTGQLTGLIAQEVNKVYAFEIDRKLCDILKKNIASYPNVEIINADFLKVALGFNKSRGSFKVIGNIPYYITTPIIERLLAERQKINPIFLTVQKEFALRIVASPGTKEFGAFSCFVQYYAIPKILFTISKTCFRPVPKVDSCFLRLEIRKRPSVVVKDEKAFFTVIHKAFNQRRKILRNSLQGLISEEALDKFFKLSGIDKNIRPECLSLGDFALLCNCLYNADDH